MVPFNVAERANQCLVDSVDGGNDLNLPCAMSATESIATLVTDDQSVSNARPERQRFGHNPEWWHTAKVVVHLYPCFPLSDEPFHFLGLVVILDHDSIGCGGALCVK